MTDDTEEMVHAFLANVGDKAQAGDAAAIKLQNFLRYADGVAAEGIRRLARNSVMPLWLRDKPDA